MTEAASAARSFTMGASTITDDSAAYVVAEIGANHQGDVETAKKMIQAAALAGADAVKFQKRDNQALFTPEAYNAPYASENAFGATYGEHREALEFGKEEYVELMKEAKAQGVEFFATPWDFPSVDFLEDLDVPAYKVASCDLTNTPCFPTSPRPVDPPSFQRVGEHLTRLIERWKLFRVPEPSSPSCSAPPAIRRNLANSISTSVRLSATVTQRPRLGIPDTTAELRWVMLLMSWARGLSRNISLSIAP